MTAMNSDVLAINGGTPVRDVTSKPWPKWPIYDETEERALLDVLHSGQWWYVRGTQGPAFEKEFAALHEAQYGVACANGSVALEIALRAFGIGCGDEVIVPPYTFVATAGCVLTVSATPVFVDIEGDTLNIDPKLIEAAITPRTRAIIVVHIAGRPADMDAVMEIARKHNLYVIEDAAQAHLASWRGKRIGAIGDLGTFSFQASKNLNSGEGGIIISNNEEYADAAWSVMNVGRVRSGKWYEHRVLGGNYRITEFQSAILRAQMTRLPQQTEKRSANGAYLHSLLESVDGIDLPRKDSRITQHVYHLFTFRYDPSKFGGKSLEEFIVALSGEGVPATNGYVPLFKEQVFARRANRDGAWCQAGRTIDYPNLHLPVCEAVCKSTVWLEQTLLLGERKDMEDIAEAIQKVQRAFA
jgi:dTDP-4-amino-4,6-dideoxygalactose transaminase